MEQYLAMPVELRQHSLLIFKVTIFFAFFIVGCLHNFAYRRKAVSIKLFKWCCIGCGIFIVIVGSSLGWIFSVGGAITIMGLYYLLSKTLKTSQKQVVSQVGVKEELPKGFAWKFMLALVLIPVSLLASFILGGQNSKTALVPNLMLKALGVIIVSAVITAVIAVVCDKVRDKKRFNYLRWLCLAFWMISGIVPGFLGLGWEFAACIAGGESFGFYYLFEFIWLQREIKAVLANGQGKNSS